VSTSRLDGIANLRVARGASLARLTAFGVGGAAEILAVPADREALRALLRAAREEGLDVFVLGGGTNLIVRDGGIRGVTLRLGSGFEEVRTEGATLVAGAGLALVPAASAAQAAGLTGLEWAAAVPGTVGGAVSGNAGAHGSDTGSILARVEGISLSGEDRAFERSEISISYRRTVFPEPIVVTRAAFALRPGDPAEIRARMESFREHRRRTQPLRVRNAGSMFKNPPGDYAGRLLEAAGAKGLRVGGARVSTLHANFVVNDGNATAKDILDLAAEMRRRVEAGTGVALEMEVRVVGEP
jgi:UDP-N-acetylmuramate dehydrogenase